MQVQPAYLEAQECSILIFAYYIIAVLFIIPLHPGLPPPNPCFLHPLARTHARLRTMQAQSAYLEAEECRSLVFAALCILQGFPLPWPCFLRLLLLLRATPQSLKGPAIGGSSLARKRVLH